MYGLSKKEYAQYVLLKQNASKFAPSKSSFTFNEKAYRNKYVRSKKNIGTKDKPNLVWWDSNTGTPYDADKVTNAHIDKEYSTKYNTTTPLNDLRYLERKLEIGRVRAAIKGELGPLSSFKSSLSTPIEGGGLEIDFSRRNRIKELEKSLPGLLEKSSYKNITNEDTNSPGTTVKPKEPVIDTTNVLEVLQQPLSFNLPASTKSQMIALQNSGKLTKKQDLSLKNIMDSSSEGILT